MDEQHQACLSVSVRSIMIKANGMRHLEEDHDQWPSHIRQDEMYSLAVTQFSEGRIFPNNRTAVPVFSNNLVSLAS